MLGYLARLHATIALPSQQTEATVLFVHRAGVRLLQLYEAWLNARGMELPGNVHAFRVSRIAACKAAYAEKPSVALTAIGQELAGHDLHQVVRSLLKPVGIAFTEDFEDEPLHEFVGRDHPTARMLVSHLLEQSRLYTEYLSALTGSARRIILVDSGWRGTAQLVLEQGFPQYSFEGRYFGAMARARILDSTPSVVHGIVFDSERYDPGRPETCFTVHRHLIESLLEPELESVQMITRGDVTDARKPMVIPRAGQGWDDTFAGVLACVQAHAVVSFCQQEEGYRAALKALDRSLTYPTREEVDLLCGKRRSHDLGREGDVAPVIDLRDRHEWDNATARMNDALWPMGQAALEAPDAETARIWQAGLVAACSVMSPGTSPQYFHASAEKNRVPSDGKVAIITRTKNRPLLLRRAAQSIAGQTYRNYQWVIVNDGGSLEDVLAVVNDCMVNPAQITVCNNPASLGMEAASNVGIRSSASDLVVIHDDDDSWHPDFLAATTRFLGERGGIYSGVLTHSEHVSEEIADGIVIEHSRRPYQDWVRNVHLIELCAQNFFPPIAFVFRRDIWERIGGFDERLPVLGDWDFSLRYLLEGDIGVIPKPLAYYHHRDVAGASTAGTYSNSVVAGLERHMEYASVLRNKYLRDPKTAVLANAMNAGYLQSDLRTRIASIPPVLTQELMRTRPGSVEFDVVQAMDERWVIMHALAERVVRSEKLAVSASALVREARTNFSAVASGAAPAEPEDFDEAGYLAKYPDVAAAVAEGRFPSGYVHYVRFGRQENRARVARSMH